ncbi:MAG: hypothetical protein DELT_02865 [Desulfovibrio sp.]
MGDRKVAALLVSVVLVWGVNWTVTKIIVSAIPPVWATAIRALIAVVALFLFQSVARTLVIPKRRDLPTLCVVALFHMVLFAVFMAVGLQHISVGRSIVLGYTTPLWVAPVAWLLLGEAMPARKIGGIIIGLLGLVVLMNPLTLDWSDTQALTGNGLLLLAAASWAASILCVRAFTWHSTPFQLSPWQNLLAAALMIPLALYWEGPLNFTLTPSLAVALAYIVVASMLPQLLISPLAGVWADRYNRKYLIMWADATIALATLALALVYMAGDKNLELLLGIAAVRSLGAGVQGPAVNAVVPQLVPRASLTRFSGINQSLHAAMQLLAPAAGGMVLAVFGLSWAFMLDVVTAVFAIAILRFVLIPPVATTNCSNVWADLREGLSYMWGKPLLKSLILCYGVTFILITPTAFLTPIMLERSFGNDVRLLTVQEIVWTAGTLAGGMYISWRGAFRNKVRVIALSLVGFGLTSVGLGAATVFPVYLVFMGLAGLVLPFFTTAETVLIQESVESGMMGRVFSILQITALAAMPIAMLGFGPLADVVRIEGILLVTGALLALVGGAFLKLRSEEFK